MSGNEKRLVRIQVTMAVVTVTFCLLFVPRWGILGAAIAAAIGNVATNVWCLLEVRMLMKLFPYNRTYWGLAVPTAVTLAAAIGLRVGLRSVKADVAVLTFSTALVYVIFVGTVLLLGLEADDRLIATAIWSRIRNCFPGVPDSTS
jgi:O-antigen/teichoic acid export membrane protein